MKQRNYFVSNSSSSSYICEVCGNEYSGYDACLDDAGMYKCEHGHVFCEDHIDDEVFKAWRERQIKEYMETNKFCSYEDADDQIYWDDLRYGLPGDVCPCCTLKTIVDNDLITYLLHISNTTRLECEESIRSKFKNSKELNITCGGK